MSFNEYPIVELTAQGVEVVPHTGVDLETLSSQLLPVRDALLELFDTTPLKNRGGLQRLEVGLSVTRDGRVAFATGNATASLTLTFERRQPASSARPAKPRSTEPAKAKPVEPAESDGPAGTAKPDFVRLA